MIFTTTIVSSVTIHWLECFVFLKNFSLVQYHLNTCIVLKRMAIGEDIRLLWEVSLSVGWSYLICIWFYTGLERDVEVSRVWSDFNKKAIWRKRRQNGWYVQLLILWTIVHIAIYYTCLSLAAVMYYTPSSFVYFLRKVSEIVFIQCDVCLVVWRNFKTFF
jgi:hypothetical protein